MNETQQQKFKFISRMTHQFSSSQYQWNYEDPVICLGDDIHLNPNQ